MCKKKGEMNGRVCLLPDVNAVKRFVEHGVEGLGDMEFMARKDGMVLKINQMLQGISNLPTVQLSAVLHTQVAESELAEAIYLQPDRLVDICRAPAC